MKLIIDDANIENIKELYKYYPIDGVTTNPSILARAGKMPYYVLKEIRDFIGYDQLHVQAVSLSAEGIIEEAKDITGALGKETYIKIPAIEEGFKAMKALCRDGFNITATVVYTPMQAVLAAKCGARYVAPYINRIDNMGYDGVETAKKIQDIFNIYNFKTGILGASFKNSNQVLELCRYGVEACTCSPEVIRNFVKNAAIDSAVNDFIKDFEGLAGSGASMKIKKE